MVPFYVVGDATATALADIRHDYGSPLSPIDIRGGSESNTSERLAHFILKDLSSPCEVKKLLYLTGDKNWHTLRNILIPRSIDLHSLKVYETQGSTSFANDFSSAIKTLPTGEAQAIHHLVSSDMR